MNEILTGFYRDFYRDVINLCIQNSQSFQSRHWRNQWGFRPWWSWGRHFRSLGEVRSGVPSSLPWLLDQAATIESYYGIWWDFNGFESWVDDSWCAPNYSNLCFKLSEMTQISPHTTGLFTTRIHQPFSCLSHFTAVPLILDIVSTTYHHVPILSHFPMVSQVEFFTNLPISK